MKNSEQYFEQAESLRYTNRYKGRTFNILEAFYLNYRLRKIINNLKNFECGFVADIGCGSGELLNYIEKSKPDNKLITGMDYSMAMLEAAGEKLQSKKILLANAENLPYKNECFDILFCIGVLPYLDGQQYAISELYRVLKKEGVCFFSYPYKKTILSFFRTNSLGLWIRKNILKTAIYSVKYDRGDFLRLLEGKGFSIKKEIRLLLSEYLLIVEK